MPGANAVVPRSPSLEAILTRYSRRLRRLEINHRYPSAGTAVYGASYSLSPAATWTADFTVATTSQADQIGLELAGAGLDIPPGWIAWVTVGVTLTCTDPPTGEALLWSISVGEGASEYRADVLLDGAQTVIGSVAAPAGWDGESVAVTLGEMSTSYGTEFTPESMGMAVVAIQLPTAGWASGGPS